MQNARLKVRCVHEDIVCNRKLPKKWAFKEKWSKFPSMNTGLYMKSYLSIHISS